MNAYINRMIRAAKLDDTLYGEVEKDRDALQQAIGVVALSSIASGIGYGGQLFGGMAAALIGWFIWSYITYFLGTKLLAEEKTKADYGELLRAIGFACSPGLLMILGIVPILRPTLALIIQIWIFAGMVIAIKKVLDFKSTGRAVMVCFFGWVVYALIMALFGAMRF